MKNIKLILLIFFAFILVPVAHAEECDEEAINQMREEINKSDYSLKLEYNEKEKNMYAKIVDLPEEYEAFITSGEESNPLSSEKGVKVNSGIAQLSITRELDCGTLDILSTIIKIPYYDTSKKNVFADGSIVEETGNKINIKRILLIGGLSITVIGLLIIAYIMIKGRIKHEK